MPRADDDIFDEEKAQTCFDGWMVSLPTAKTGECWPCQKMNKTDALREAASFVGIDEKLYRNIARSFSRIAGDFPHQKCKCFIFLQVGE